MCISIGLTIGKVPTVGVVYNPIMDEVRNFYSSPMVNSGGQLSWSELYMVRDFLLNMQKHVTDLYMALVISYV